MSRFAESTHLHPLPIGPRLSLSSTLIGSPSRLSGTAAILDALVQVAVSDREIIAVAVALPSLQRPKKLTLFFAANDPVPEATRLYLRQLIELLQSLAKAHAENTAPVADPLQDSLSKTAAKETDQGPHDQICDFIFLHCLSKNFRRLAKNKPFYEDITAQAKDIWQCLRASRNAATHLEYKRVLSLSWKA